MHLISLKFANRVSRNLIADYHSILEKKLCHFVEAEFVVQLW